MAERLGLQRHAEWDEILAKLAPLATSPDGISYRRKRVEEYLISCEWYSC